MEKFREVFKRERRREGQKGAFLGEEERGRELTERAGNEYFNNRQQGGIKKGNQSKKKKRHKSGDAWTLKRKHANQKEIKQ